MRDSATLLLTLVCPVVLPAQRTLRAVPELTISAAVNDFSVISRLAVSGRGVVAVPQPQDHRILFFDPSGRRLGEFGSEGEGPGEFRSMLPFGWIGDTLLVRDTRLRRVTMIGPDQKLVRTARWGEGVLPPTGRGTSVSGSRYVQSILPGDRQVIGVGVRLATLPSWFPEASVDEVLILVLGADGRLERHVGTRPSNAHCAIRLGDAQFVVPFCSDSRYGTSPDGRFAYVMVPGQPGSYAVTVMRTSDGDTLYSKVLRHTPKVVAQATADSVRANERRGIPIPEYFPALRREHLGDDGSLWLEEYSRHPEPRRVRILDASGDLIGILALQSRVDVSVVSRDGFWGLVRDEDDVADVVRYRIQ